MRLNCCCHYGVVKRSNSNSITIQFVIKVIYDKNGSKGHEEKFQANRVQTKALRKEIQNV